MSKSSTQHLSHSETRSLNHDTRFAKFECVDEDVPPSVSQHANEHPSEQLPPRNASIRYVKNGRWKVQYDDGRFEWVGEDNPGVCEVKPAQHSDHSSYHAGNPPDHADSSSLIRSPRLKR
ncbi:unnamed protein product, partial [Strongylus vulgaris]